MEWMIFSEVGDVEVVAAVVFEDRLFQMKELARRIARRIRPATANKAGSLLRRSCSDVEGEPPTHSRAELASASADT